ncbi:unnamed protein product [Caenorhabditis auriculariae]|uniref:Uncharacterized protein n=1 Tax=Caenorhabditis auriculariae TaxID=2777116 RepID=A0A8S1GUZ4_9PELO|nr:unnamed protein product [Caenorhabditis auriculariae]
MSRIGVSFVHPGVIAQDVLWSCLKADASLIGGSDGAKSDVRGVDSKNDTRLWRNAPNYEAQRKDGSKPIALYILRRHECTSTNSSAPDPKDSSCVLLSARSPKMFASAADGYGSLSLTFDLFLSPERYRDKIHSLIDQPRRRHMAVAQSRFPKWLWEHLLPGLLAELIKHLTLPADYFPEHIFGVADRLDPILGNELELCKVVLAEQARSGREAVL